MYSPDGEEAMKPTATTGELRHLLHIIEFPLGFTSIGSGAECDVSLADPRIEPLHACIVAGLSGVVLCDLSSAGILVNGSMIRGATLLRDGDRLQMGGERFVFATAPSAKKNRPRGYDRRNVGAHDVLAARAKAKERPSGTHRIMSHPRAGECLADALDHPGGRDGT